jgi:signal transduction histidine kinase
MRRAYRQGLREGVPKEVLDRFWKMGNVGVGLPGIRERLKELGGFLEIESNLDGTLLKATIPVASTDAFEADGAEQRLLTGYSPAAPRN